MKHAICAVFIAVVLVAFVVTSAGCDSSLAGLPGLLNPDCFDADAITAEEYDDLPAWEKVFWDKNSCGLYEEGIGDAVDEIEDWF